MGAKKLAPSISPNKTWSGFGVSLFFTAICSVVFMKELLWGFVLGLAIGLVTQMGDLFISAVKRFYDVKDTGKILPAHGGLLDRLDGAIAVIILAALFLLISGVGFSPLSPYFNVFLLGFFNG